MYELFIEYIDQLYYDGYAEEMLLDNPDKAAFEMQQFLEAYN